MRGALRLLLEAARAQTGVAATGYFYAGVTENETDQTVYTSSAFSIGTAQANRKVIAMVFGAAASNGSPTVTCNGVDMGTPDMTEGSVTRTFRIYHLDVPTGSTATIEATWSVTQSRCALAVYYLYSDQSAPTAASNSGSVDTAATSASLAISAITQATNGVILAGFVTSDATPIATDWTQTSGSGTERYDELIGTGSASGIYDTQATGSQALTATKTGGSLTWRGGAVTWELAA